MVGSHGMLRCYRWIFQISIGLLEVLFLTAVTVDNVLCASAKGGEAQTYDPQKASRSKDRRQRSTIGRLKRIITVVKVVLSTPATVSALVSRMIDPSGTSRFFSS